jgi:hypothetical protein
MHSKELRREETRKIFVNGGVVGGGRKGKLSHLFILRFSAAYGDAWMSAHCPV